MSYQSFDFVIYGATPAGITAAVTAARLKKSVLLLEPTSHFGGMMTSGLNAIDALFKPFITGVSREFFIRLKLAYSTAHLPVRVESRMASTVFMQMIADLPIELRLKTPIVDMEREQDRLTQARLADGSLVAADCWMDATYEGDLMEISQIPHRVGRDSYDDFKEPFGGRMKAKSFLPWRGGPVINPYKDGRLRPFLSPRPTTQAGDRDGRVQAYCIRPTLTNISEPHLRAPIKAPEDFDFSTFDMFRELARSLPKAIVRASYHRNMGNTFKSAYFNLAELPNGKWDMNSGPIAPINIPALTDGWLDMSYEQREERTEEFRRYTLAILYFIQNDPSVPRAVQKFFADFSLPADEYVEHGNLPPAVYVREGRRLLGEHTFTQHHVENGGVPVDEAVCAGCYFLDCKPVRWMPNSSNDNVVREGMFFAPKTELRYNIPAWVMLPERKGIRNFLSLCGVSASHAAFGSFRMEPIWMEIGNVAPLIAMYAQSMHCNMHDVPPSAVRMLRDQPSRQRLREHDPALPGQTTLVNRESA